MLTYSVLSDICQIEIVTKFKLDGTQDEKIEMVKLTEEAFTEIQETIEKETKLGLPQIDFVEDHVSV